MKSSQIRPKKKTLYVSVTQGLAGNMMPDIDPKTTPLIDCARGCWRVNPIEVRKCAWLMAVDKGYIVGVYEIDTDFGWNQVTLGCIPTRHILKNDPTRYYCKLRDISLSEGKSYVHQYKRMYREAQYSN